MEKDSRNKNPKTCKLDDDEKSEKRNMKRQNGSWRIVSDERFGKEKELTDKTGLMPKMINKVNLIKLYRAVKLEELKQQPTDN